MPEPWSMEQRSRVKAKIDKEAARAAARLGARTVAIIAFFPAGGEYMHMLDGGTAPMPLKELYTKLAASHEIVEQSDGKDVPIQ